MVGRKSNGFQTAGEETVGNEKEIEENCVVPRQCS